MSKSFAEKEFTKIMSQDSDSAKNTALASAWVIADYKGLNLKIIDMKQSSSLADYYVLGSTENPTTSRSIADSLQRHYKNHKISVRSLEGVEEGEWILIDAGDVIVHIFLENVRDIFDLDNLFRENPTVAIPQEYYFANRDEKSEETTENYF